MMQSFIKILIVVFIMLSFRHNSYSQPEKVLITYKKEGENWIFYATNTTIVPYYVKLQFKELDNLKPDKDLESYTPTIPGSAKNLKILTLSPIAADKSRNFNFNYIYTIGEPEKSPDLSHPYWLPYRHGKRASIAQGNLGDGTHRGINAIDFNLKVGDTVFASRAGLVYDVKEDSDKGGNSMKFEQFGNYISVYHSDGTTAKYVHLMKNGAFPKIGDAIEAGEAIGLSGNTGYSSGPHLHFVVAHNDNFVSKTLPAKFLNYKEALFIPIEGKSYYAYHPGNAAFEVIDEENFDESKFEKQLTASTLTNDLQIESEAYGDYTLLYINNGYEKTLSGKLTINKINMDATKTLPYSFTVSGKSKQYLLALKPKDLTKKYSYDLSVQIR